MDIGVFAVRDKVADNFLNPFVAVNVDVAIRQFKAAFSDENTIMGQNPGDFELHYIGIFNTSTGLITTINDTVVSRGDD